MKSYGGEQNNKETDSAGGGNGFQPNIRLHKVPYDYTCEFFADDLLTLSVLKAWRIELG